MTPSTEFSLSGEKREMIMKEKGFKQDSLSPDEEAGLFLPYQEQGMKTMDREGDKSRPQTQGKETHRKVYIIPKEKEQENAVTHWNKTTFPSIGRGNHPLPF
jgi:hypothetical protein